LLVLVLVSTLGMGIGDSQAASPDEVVKVTSDKMQAALKQNRSTLERDPSRIYELVDKILLPRFDFDLIARWALGKYWKQANAAQRRRFTDEFRTLLVRTYAKVLLEYIDEKIYFPPSPPPAAGRDDALVRTEVRPSGQTPIAVNYRVHSKRGDWLVFDVVVDGISLVTNYRKTFADQIRNMGMDGMINELARTNARRAS
jgi:phospholipid transport system substrate-binding protein